MTVRSYTRIDAAERQLMLNFADVLRRAYTDGKPDRRGNIRMRLSDVKKAEYIVRELLTALPPAD